MLPYQGLLTLRSCSADAPAACRGSLRRVKITGTPLASFVGYLGQQSRDGGQCVINGAATFGLMKR